MTSNASVRFFDQQFQRQLQEGDLRLNPFELMALPHLQGRVLDHGCGLGNLALAAARRGCSVLALDASPTAVERLRRIASEEGLSLQAEQVDLRSHELHEDFDTVVSIGLLMFMDCPTAIDRLRHLQAHVRPGGLAVVNVLVQGTTYLDMFDPTDYCLFARDELHREFAGWEILQAAFEDFPAPNGQIKSFATLIARKPGASPLARRS